VDRCLIKEGWDMSINNEIPDEELLNNAPRPVIHKVTAKLTRKKSEDKMSFVEFTIYVTEKILFPNKAEISIGKKKFTVTVCPADNAGVYQTSPIPCELGEKIAIYTIDGKIKFSINGKIVEEYFSSMAMNSINLERLY
jgi:hypothetical protein